MASRNQRFELPDGSVYTVTGPAADSGGDWVEMEWQLPADCLPPPPHVHPSQVEEYEVLEGSLDIIVDGERTTLRAGESASVPRATLHTFANSSGAGVRVRNFHRPAVRFEEFIETLDSTLKTAGITSRRDPRVPLYISMVMGDFSDTLVPGRKRERIPMQAMARIGRLLYRRKTGAG
jgi:mannose-6-phosphate isomerase-like protein (cupin superfamily)